jgi:hypothetical protein
MSDMEMQPEPGLDRHVFESQWESLQDDLADAPAETLAPLADLVGEMLRASGVALDDPVAAGGDDPEFVVEYREARRVADSVARGDDYDPGDVGDAIESLRELYSQLIEDTI